MLHLKRNFSILQSRIKVSIIAYLIPTKGKKKVIPRLTKKRIIMEKNWLYHKVENHKCIKDHKYRL